MKLLAAAVLIAAADPAAQDKPRVVSLDYCSDQYVLALADRDQILGISTGPDAAYSALRDQAEGLPRVRDAAEDVISQNPDLIIRSYGGGPRARTFYDRLGLPVHNLGFANSFDDVRNTIREAAHALGHPERGEALITRMEADLLAARTPYETGAPAVLYVTPSGVTTGQGTMMHEILTAAGFDNIAGHDGARGWRDLPLEALVLDPPELIVTGFFDTPTNHVNNWSPTRHPALRDQLKATPTIHLDGGQLTCGAWFMAEAARIAREQAEIALEAAQ